jgi:hypothetical protein
MKTVKNCTVMAILTVLSLSFWTGETLADKPSPPATAPVGEMFTYSVSQAPLIIPAGFEMESIKLNPGDKFVLIARIHGFGLEQGRYHKYIVCLPDDIKLSSEANERLREGKGITIVSGYPEFPKDHPIRKGMNPRAIIKNSFIPDYTELYVAAPSEALAKEVLQGFVAAYQRWLKEKWQAYVSAKLKDAERGLVDANGVIAQYEQAKNIFKDAPPNLVELKSDLAKLEIERFGIDSKIDMINELAAELEAKKASQAIKDHVETARIDAQLEMATLVGRQNQLELLLQRAKLLIDDGIIFSARSVVERYPEMLKYDKKFLNSTAPAIKLPIEVDIRQVEVPVVEPQKDMSGESENN